MKNGLVEMLEDIKCGQYTTFYDYLDDDSIQELYRWFNKYSNSESVVIERIIDLMYELYIRENIDCHPVDEYERIVSNLASQFRFKAHDFLDLYACFRKMVFAVSG